MGIPRDISAIFDSPTMPSLGPEARESALSINQCKKITTEAIENANIGRIEGGLILSAALLWHDYLSESHTISQSIHTQDGSYLHGIMHRREPDYSNAKYWFHKTGNYSGYDILSVKAETILGNTSLSSLTKGRWDPFTMVDSVSQAKHGTCEYELLQKVQQAEFQTLLEKTFN